MTTKIGEQIYTVIQPYITPETEETFIKNLICELFFREVEPEDTETIMKKVYQSLLQNKEYTNNNWDWADYEIFIDEIYLEDETPNAGLDGLNVYLSDYLKKSDKTYLINTLRTLLKPYEGKGTYSLQVGSNNYIVMNRNKKRVEYETINTNKNGDNTTFETILNAYPREVIIHDSPLTDMGRTFTIKWISSTSSRVFETKQMGITEICNYLLESAWVLSPKHLKTGIAGVIDMSISNDLATIKTDIDNPGFYWDTKTEQLIKVNIELPEYNTNNLRKGLKILNELGENASIEKSKLATSLKWGLVAPFNFARKQFGAGWMPWLFLQGKAQSGKTTVGKIVLYLWDLPNETNNIGGSGFDTPARVGEKLGISTLPLLVNEPEGALEKPSVMGLIKSAIESTVARGKFTRGRYTNLPSFAPTIITSNPVLTQADSILRRFLVISFSHNEKQDKAKAKKFDQHFGLETPSQSPLLDFHHIGSFVFNELSEDTSLLKLDWQELADTLLTRAYSEVGEEVPSWLRLWYESTSLEDLDDDEIESIRMFLMEEINKHSKQIKKYTESGYLAQEETYTLDDMVSDGSEFKERVFDVLNHHLIPWMGVRETRTGDNQVYFTAGAKKFIGKVTTTCKDLKSIAQLLGWKYGSVSGLSGKNMTISLDSFVDFLLMKDE